MVGLYTGLRFKDWPKVLTAPLKQTASGNEYYEIATQKTGTVVMIPATEQLKKLLSQKPSFKISDQKFNSYVKELCRLAGLNKAITIVHTVGGERKTKIEPQWSQISSHTARRSFATNMYLAGFEKSLIMGITGHKTEAAFMKYLKQDASSNIDLIMAQMAKNL